jgi:hypothetical protein
MRLSYLSQQEHMYELCIQGISIDGDGWVLWKVLLSLSELIMIKFENLGDFDPHDHINYTEARIQELKALLDQPVSNISPFVSSCNNTTVI